MPNSNEVLRSAYGAYRLARFDASGLAWFDVSIEGFWRSFFAAVLVAPFFVIMFMLEPTAAEGGRSFVAEIARYFLQWSAFPFAMIYLSRLLGVSARYVPYIVALNWSAVVQVALIFPLTVAASLAGEGAGLEPLLGVAFIALMIYHWFITRTALGTDALASAGLVALDFLLSLLINIGTTSLLGDL